MELLHLVREPPGNSGEANRWHCIVFFPLSEHTQVLARVFTIPSGMNSMRGGCLFVRIPTNPNPVESRHKYIILNAISETEDHKVTLKAFLLPEGAKDIDITSLPRGVS